jgi:hypothetical protein
MYSSHETTYPTIQEIICNYLGINIKDAMINHTNRDVTNKNTKIHKPLSSFFQKKFNEKIKILDTFQLFLKIQDESNLNGDCLTQLQDIYKTLNLYNPVKKEIKTLVEDIIIEIGRHIFLIGNAAFRAKLRGFTYREVAQLTSEFVSPNPLHQIILCESYEKYHITSSNTHKYKQMDYTSPLVVLRARKATVTSTHGVSPPKEQLMVTSSTNKDSSEVALSTSSFQDSPSTILYESLFKSQDNGSFSHHFFQARELNSQKNGFKNNSEKTSQPHSKRQKLGNETQPPCSKIAISNLLN